MGANIQFCSPKIAHYQEKKSSHTGLTDSDGRVMAEHLFSRDLETYYVEGGTVDLSLGNANSILMGWGNVEWRMGENGDKRWNTRFLLNGGDYDRALPSINRPAIGELIRT